MGSAVGMFIIGSSAGLLDSETAKALVSAVAAERAGMASGIASTARFIGISFGLAGLGAVLAAVAEDSVAQLGTRAVPQQSVDWHDLSLRIVGGDAHGALSRLPLDIQTAIAGPVRESVVSGFGAVLAVALIIAMLSSLASWTLLRRVGVRSVKAEGEPLQKS